MEDKNPWDSYGKPCFHILNLSNNQMPRNMHFSNHVDTKNVPPHPPPNNVGMTEQAKVYRAAQTSTLLWGEGERKRN